MRFMYSYETRYETCDCIKYNSIESLHVDKSNMPIQRVLGANTSNYIDFEWNGPKIGLREPNNNCLEGFGVIAIR